jgi:hypothetical protein
MSKAVNNFKAIYNLLKNILLFKEEGEFYQVLVVTRKKDQDVPANHQSSRTIKTYYIESLEQLQSKEKEIIKLCKLFNARAGISPNVLNHNTLALSLLSEIVDRLKSGNKNFAYIYDKVVGQARSLRKHWLIDLDTKDEESLEKVIDYITNTRPFHNIISILPTYQGYHILVLPFDSGEFDKKMREWNIDATIHKTNYLALYYPPKNE